MQELNGRHNPAVIANLLTGLGIDEYFTRTDTSSGVTSTLLADALGSTIGLVTANNGPIATNYTYQPFGGTTVGGSANGNSYQFTGRENDGTGLYFYRARYYSPAFQRFIAQDPVDFRGGSSNLYIYALDNPLLWVDALGLDVTIIENIGANGNPFGHVTVGVNDSTPVGLTTQNDANNNAAAYGATVPGGLKPDNLAPYSSVTIKTTAAQDAAVEAAILRDIVNPPDYNLLRNNCAEEASKLLRAAGLAAPHDILPGAEIWDLSTMYNVPINYH